MPGGQIRPISSAHFIRGATGHDTYFLWGTNLFWSRRKTLNHNTRNCGTFKINTGTDITISINNHVQLHIVATPIKWVLESLGGKHSIVTNITPHHLYMYQCMIKEGENELFKLGNEMIIVQVPGSLNRPIMTFDHKALKRNVK